MKNTISKLKTKAFLKILIAAVLIIVIVGGFFYWQMRKGRVFVENALVNATLITVSPSTSGRLIEIDAQEGKSVKKGDAIAVVGSETVRSTIDGLVVAVNNQVGGSMTPQSSVAQLIDPSQMRVVGTIDENKGLNKLRVGQVASFTVDAFSNQKFWGFVDEIGPTAKQTQLSFSISSERPTQQFQVYVRFPANKYPQLKNGMSAKLVIFTDTK
jgi:multidrug resistance efflux pump